MTAKAKQAHKTPKEGAPPIKADRFDEMMRKALQVPPPSHPMPGQQKATGGRSTGKRGRRQDA